MPETDDALEISKARSERIATLFKEWRERDFSDDETETRQEKLDRFFLTVTDKEIIQMCKLDDDNPLTCLDHLVQLQGAGVIPSLPSFAHVMNVYTANIDTIRAEICRAVRRGRVK